MSKTNPLFLNLTNGLKNRSTRAAIAKAHARHRSCGLLNSFLFLRARITNECRQTQGRHGVLDQSISDGPLQSADNASAKVFCDVDRGHLIQVDTTDFFGDLLSPSYAVVFAIDHELISIGRGFGSTGS